MRTHLLGDPTCQHIAEVSRRHTKHSRTTKFLDRSYVIDNLGHHPHPVDRVNSRKLVGVTKFLVVKHRFNQVLAIIKCAINSDSVHIWRSQCRHLSALHIAHSIVWVEHHEVDISTRRHTIKRRATSVATGRTNNHHAFVALRQNIVKQLANKLQRHIFKRQCRPVKQFEQIFIWRDFYERCDIFVTKCRICLDAKSLKNLLINFIADKRRHNARCPLRITRRRTIFC